MTIIYKPLFASQSDDSLQDPTLAERQRLSPCSPFIEIDVENDNMETFPSPINHTCHPGFLSNGKVKKKTLQYIPGKAIFENEDSFLHSVPFAVLFYLVVSILMVLINKYVLNQVSLPLSFLWIQLAISFSILKFFNLVQWLPIQDLAFKERWKDIAPLIIVNVLGLSLNTYCLAYLDASLYQVARSLVLPLTVLFSRLYLEQPSSFMILLSCMIIVSGFVIGIVMERQIHISLLGIFFGLASSVTTAYHSIVIKKSFDFFKPLPSIKSNICLASKRPAAFTFDLVYWNNFLSAILLIPFLFLLEGPQIIKSFQSLFQYENTDAVMLDWSSILSLVVGSFIAGISGLLVNIAGFLQIKVTSPVTHTVSSAARGVIQTLLATLLLHEKLTLFRLIGISVTSLGTCLYTFIKTKENEQRLLDDTTLPLHRQNISNK